MNHNKQEFYNLYSKHGLTLNRCVHCKMLTSVDYRPGYGVMLHCPAGDDVVVFKNKQYPGLTDEEIAVKAVETWNNRNKLEKRW